MFLYVRSLELALGVIYICCFYTEYINKILYVVYMFSDLKEWVTFETAVKESISQ